MTQANAAQAEFWAAGSGTQGIVREALMGALLSGVLTRARTRTRTRTTEAVLPNITFQLADAQSHAVAIDAIADPEAPDAAKGSVPTLPHNGDFRSLIARHLRQMFSQQSRNNIGAIFAAPPLGDRIDDIRQLRQAAVWQRLQRQPCLCPAGNTQSGLNRRAQTVQTWRHQGHAPWPACRIQRLLRCLQERTRRRNADQRQHVMAQKIDVPEPIHRQA